MSEETILLVSEDASFLRVLKRALDSADYSVDTVRNSAEALQAFTEAPYSALVATLDGPDYANASLVRALAEESPYTECVVISPDPESLVALELYQLGNVFSHRTRPVEDMREVLWDVVRALERRHLRRQNARLLIQLRDTRDEHRSQFEFLTMVESLAELGLICRDTAEEIRHPLRAIQGYADLLERSLAPRRATDMAGDQLDRASSYASELSHAAAQCLAVVEGLSGYSPDSADDRQCNAGDVIHDSLDLLRHTLESRGITLAVDLDDALPELPVSSFRLRQALRHLAMNAMLAMPQGGTLTVRTEQDGCDGPVTISVSDTGIGIPQQALPRVFEPFFTTRPLGVGTGLGLSLVQSVVQDADGTISIDSTVGLGTTVSLTLPAVVAQPVPEAVYALAA